MKVLRNITLLLLTALLPARAAATDIPLTVGNYLTTSESATTGNINNNDGGNLGGIYKNATATFTLTNASAQEMVLYFLTGNNNDSNPQVTVTLNDGTSDFFEQTVDVEKTGSWTPSSKHIMNIGTVPAGTVTLKFAFTNTSSYVCNLGSIGLYSKTAYDATLDAIPGTITLGSGTYNGPKVESAGNVGYVQNGGTASYLFYNGTEGAYDLSVDIYRYNQGGTMNVKITDQATGEADYDADYTIANDAPAAYTTNTITVPNITTGYKTMTFTFSNGSSYICNYKNVSLAYKGVAAEFSAYTIDEQTVGTGTETDYLCNLPVSYAATTTFAVSATNGTLVVTAKDDTDNNLTVTDGGDGTYSIATPAMGKYAIVTATLTPNPGAAAAKTTSTLKIFRIGELSLTSVLVDGTAVDVLTDINDSPYTATYNGCYTTTPVVAAVQVDGANATVDAPAIDGSTYTYTIHGAFDGTDISRDYTLILNNVHVYEASANDESIAIKNNEGTREDGVWTNGVYSLSTTSLDGYNQYFKMNGNDYTISLPADVVVKQLIFKEVSNNYAGNDARLQSVTSNGATAYIPVKNKFYHDTEGSKYDLVVNIEGHTAGEDISFSLPKSGQPMCWIELTIEKQAVTTPPAKTGESVTVVNNHAVVAVTFDREIAADVQATINAKTVTAEGGTSTLYFPVWNLDYSTDYNLVIAAGAVEDAYGNTNTANIEIAVSTEAKATVEQVVYDYVVGNAEELTAAVAAVNASNTSATATRKTIFLKNGDYDLGAKVGEGVSLLQLKCYNVSLIGESRDGVVIHGDVDGISNPVLNLRDRSGFYLQDLTVRNDRDFGNGLFNGGVAVAIYGGDKTVMKNVRMLSNQDTQVTGHRAYFEDCQIHGTVDFICGGGDNFYYHTDLVLENRNGDVIAAPSTSSACKWGYVFQECTIKAAEEATVVTNGSWNLGRPWQNEPRAYYLNTTMKVLPDDNGWAGMSTLPTHFYEYNSMDADGNALDLSGRGNSSTSTNNYTPVLSTEQAAAYTVENVLGSIDSWLPTELTVTLVAPMVSLSGTTLSWTAVDDVRCYVVFKDGEYLTNQTETSIALTAPGQYTVRAANFVGGLGETSDAVRMNSTVTTGATGWASACVSYDAQVPAGTKAYYIGETTDEAVVLEELSVIPANEGFLFNAPAGSYELQPATVSVPAISNLLVGTAESTPVEANSIYVLGKADETHVAMMRYTGTSIAAGKAYLPVTAVPSGTRALRIVLAGEATAINSFAEVEPQPTANLYDLQGRRVQKAVKGVYIQYGKKIIK